MKITKRQLSRLIKESILEKMRVLDLRGLPPGYKVRCDSCWQTGFDRLVTVDFAGERGLSGQARMCEACLRKGLDLAQSPLGPEEEP